MTENNKTQVVGTVMNSSAIMYIVILIAVIVIFYLIWKYLTKNIQLVL